MGWGGGREVQEGGDIGIHIADSLHCMAETYNVSLFDIFSNMHNLLVAGHGVSDPFQQYDLKAIRDLYLSKSPFYESS